MRYEVLGPLRVIDRGTTIDIGGPRQQAVLAVLLAAAPDRVSVDRLVDEIWGDDPPGTASHVIRTYVSNLNAILGSRIESDGRRYRLLVDDDQIDAGELTAAVEDARALVEIDPAGALERLEPVSSLRRGRAFEGVSDEAPTVRVRAGGLEEQWLEGTELRIEAALRLGRHRSAVGELESLVQLHPLRERFAEQLMMALYRSRRQAEALAVYRRLRTRLLDELGLDPSPSLQDLEERILLQDPALDLQPPHNLPAPVSSFIGRSRELEEVVEAVGRARLVTLVGVGGVGKSRLASEAGPQLLPGSPDGVWWVDLAPLDDASAVLTRVATMLGLSPQPGLPVEEVLRRYLSHRRALFVFDNCEHLAVADPVQALLEAGPGIKVVATSRRALGVAGEVRYPVSPLGLPDPDGSGGPVSDAEQLFVARSRDVDPAAAADHDAGAVARICRRVDGLPLAIEMAAAHVRALSPRQIADRLELGSFDLLGSRQAGRTSRHPTLEATIGLSHDLLSPAERTVFDRLSVFVGSFDLGAAEAVTGFDPIGAGEVLDAVDGLVDASMLTATRGEEGIRYRMLQTLRDFAGRRLADVAAEGETARRHAHYHLELLIEAGRLRMTPEFAALAGRLDAASDDVLAGLDWLLDHEPDRAIEAAGGLAEYWSRRGDAVPAYRYGRRMLDAAPDAPDPLRADGLACASFGAAICGDLELTRWGPSEAVKLAAEAAWPTRLSALHVLGESSVVLGDLDRAEWAGNAILELCSAEGLVLPRAYGSSLLGSTAFFRGGDFELAGRHLDDAIEGMRSLRDLGGMKIYGLITASTAAAARGDFASAERYAAEAISIPGTAPWTAAAYIVLAGYTLLPQGQLERAGRVMERGTRLSYETGNEVWMRTGFLFLACLAAMEERWEPAARLFGACRPHLPAWARDPRWWALEPVARERLGDHAYDRLCATGQVASPDTVLEWIGDVVD